MKLHAPFLVAFAIWSLPHLAADSPRPAWAWSDEERFAALVDDAAATRRLEADRRREKPRRGIATTGQAGTGNGLPKVVDVIDGSRDPHLFFAWELFHQMVVGAYADDAEHRLAYRQSNEGVRKSLGLPDDMWERMEPMVVPYRAAQQRARDEALTYAGRDLSTIESSRTAFEVCNQRHQALLEAQQTFGDAFTRFLYLGVAPSMYRVAIGRPGTEVLRMARGECE